MSVGVLFFLKYVVVLIWAAGASHYMHKHDKPVNSQNLLIVVFPIMLPLMIDSL